jgi:hypothetical protein
LGCGDSRITGCSAPSSASRSAAPEARCRSPIVSLIAPPEVATSTA